ncbi:hypothetical protein DF051_09630 [Burkholderia contaminans]|uniref:Uncharacterized protein n=1 Tax=Burkholderia contaminans TaxID=488447 RepID=A0A3N8QI08_9BURK|nr:hypothetical protein DF051_09630 [Burkholderia contaminans]
MLRLLASTIRRADEPPTKGRAVLWGVDPETGPGHEDRYWNPADHRGGDVWIDRKRAHGH